MNKKVQLKNFPKGLQYCRSAAILQGVIQGEAPFAPPALGGSQASGMGLPASLPGGKGPLKSRRDEGSGGRIPQLGNSG